MIWHPVTAQYSTNGYICAAEDTLRVCGVLVQASRATRRCIRKRQTEYMPPHPNGTLYSPSPSMAV